MIERFMSSPKWKENHSGVGLGQRVQRISSLFVIHLCFLFIFSKKQVPSARICQSSILPWILHMSLFVCNLLENISAAIINNYEKKNYGRRAKNYFGNILGWLKASGFGRIGVNIITPAESLFGSLLVCSFVSLSATLRKTPGYVWHGT